jgi:hypothetical protein
MKRYMMKPILLFMAIAFTIPLAADEAQTLDGRMQGYNCVTDIGFFFLLTYNMLCEIVKRFQLDWLI